MKPIFVWDCFKTEMSIHLVNQWRNLYLYGETIEIVFFSLPFIETSNEPVYCTWAQNVATPHQIALDETIHFADVPHNDHTKCATKWDRNQPNTHFNCGMDENCAVEISWKWLLMNYKWATISSISTTENGFVNMRKMWCVGKKGLTAIDPNISKLLYLKQLCSCQISKTNWHLYSSPIHSHQQVTNNEHTNKRKTIYNTQTQMNPMSWLDKQCKLRN